MVALALLASCHEGASVFGMIVQIAWLLGSIDEGHEEHVHEIYEEGRAWERR